jgi:hypothetical protein
VVNNEFEGIWTERDYCLIEVIFRHLPENTEENHEKISRNNGVATNRDFNWESPEYKSEAFRFQPIFWVTAN